MFRFPIPESIVFLLVNALAFESIQPQNFITAPDDDLFFKFGVTRLQTRREYS